ncbi:MAG: antibiotic biosynthesis monooxygenase [Flavobacteriales bacterium]|nr:antibiotic biosynthesis monooxygenase [Flavobacteriales bacterium]
MFAAVYSFKVKEGRDDEFIKAWRELTQFIYSFEGSLGSRLHHEGNGTYLAYAQWPNEEVYDKAGDNLPDEADEWRTLMRDACISITTLHKLELIDDLLKDKPSKKADQ